MITQCIAPIALSASFDQQLREGLGLKLKPEPEAQPHNLRLRKPQTAKPRSTLRSIGDVMSGNTVLNYYSSLYTRTLKANATVVRCYAP